MKVQYLLPFLLFTLLSCHSGRTVVNPVTSPMETPIFAATGPQTIIYKTGKDYYANIPVIMDEGRTRILSYPDPQDTYYQGKFAYPTRLAQGYLLDNRGIGANVVFLSYTYEEYSKLQSAPSMNELMQHIIDKYPLTEAWNCGIRTQYKDEVNELNKRIENGLTGCKKIKITPRLTINKE